MYGTEGGAGEAVQQAIEGELRLLEPRVRASRRLAAELLDPEFTEVGRSGRRWDRETMLAELATMDGPREPSQAAGTAPPRVRVSEMVGRLLAPDLVHLTYATEVGGTRALRSSLWRRGADGEWRMYYHQGTPAP
ncbi:nuclear transport factor 2 family protein [Nocardiopsis halotolerans]|uniref:nuclear transport factor 2 family protein n=1 Tax=Nocardiopsis halotolerans TaxID=124252 RepID=UPI000347DFFE|nr:nuclear transport factor 2 family protein [Nocardiopsis halotolerans]